MSSFAPSVVNAAAAAIRRAAASGADVAAVVDVLAAEQLIAEERLALVQLLLEEAAPRHPHPADLAVCAFVSLGYDEFRRPARPAILIDLRNGCQT